MKLFILFVFTYFTVVIADPFVQRATQSPVYINRPKLPKQPNRHARSADPEPQTGGSIYAHGNVPLSGPDRRPSYDFGYRHKIYENKHGSISLGAGASKFPGQRWDKNVGVSGSFRFRRAADPEPQTGGSIYANGNVPLSGPDRRPSYDLGYQHKIYENKHGSISLGAGASKFPGQHWDKNVGVSGSFRFRRAADPEPQTGGSIYANGNVPLSGPDRRPSYDFGYQHKIYENKHGSISLGAGASKFPGQHWDKNVGLSGSFRFRRAADPEPQTGGSIYAHGNVPLSGPDRRPSYDFGYQHKIYENKHGSISLGAGASKFPGQHWDKNVGVSGSFRFRRAADPEPQTGGSIYANGNVPLSGPDRRPSYDLGYQHKIYENKHGSISLGAGASKFPGQHWDKNVGVSGSFRFRRAADPEPQTGGSIYANGNVPLSGPDRRPSYDFGYRHKIYENKHGSISLGAGASKFPGQRWDKNVGLSGTFRFRRAADPEPQTGGSIYANGNVPLSGPDRRPSYDFGYRHKIYENKHGSISLGAGASKFPGQHWDKNVGISGSFRFRRAADPEPQTGGSIYANGNVPLSGPDRRPSYDFGYQHKIYENKHGSISLGAGASKFPGQHWDKNVGVSGSFRFRRSPDTELEPETESNLV